ncbi:MAG: amino acid racemase [Planctomycetes bacterium]|nr:amino acid racemase [Planctomycetota bacterium]
MTQHVGIVACSAPGAALCFETLCIEGQQVLGRYGHPEISMHCPPFAKYMKGIEAGDWDAVAELMLASARKLAQAGADFCISPDNTIHQAFDRVAAESPVPWLHIAEEVAREAERRGCRRVAVLGTKFLMEGPVYPRRLAARGIEHRVPTEGERERINEIIFDELVNHVFKNASRRWFCDVISHLEGDGCDAVVLGCTEIPLLINDDCSPLPTLDSTRILARAALRRAVGEEG